jgi:hypothetical protein
VNFDGDCLIRLSYERDNFATGEILDGMFTSRPTTVGFEMECNIGSDLRAELDSHVGTRVKTGSDTLQASKHVSYVRAKRAAEELVEGEAASIEVHHVNEGAKVVEQVIESGKAPVTRSGNWAWTAEKGKAWMANNSGLFWVATSQGSRAGVRTERT